MTYWDEKVREYQRDIDKIKDHAPNFVTRLKLVMPETVYMNMLQCPPPLTMLTSIISGNANAVLSPPVLNNATIDTYIAKGEERRKLRSEVVEIIRRLFNINNSETVYDLLSGEGKFYIPREKVYYCDIYNEVTMEEELEHLRDQNLPADRLNYSSDEHLPSEHVPSDDDASD